MLHPYCPLGVNLFDSSFLHCLTACDEAIFRNSCGIPIGLGLFGLLFLLIMICLLILSI